MKSLVEDQDGAPLNAGLFPGIPMADYLALPALGSSAIEHVGVSPLHYRYLLDHPAEPTDATDLGTALHMAVLQPELFAKTYADEPDLTVIGGAKPRATNAYKEACAALEGDGRIVLRAEQMQKVTGMATSILSHPHAAAVLRKATDREVTALWERDGRWCRGRFDALGGNLMADIKTTRKLRDFSPWTITKMGYYRQQGWYHDGAKRLGREVKYVFLIAVENVAPYDVGVFQLDEPTLKIGFDECTRLVAKLDECERNDKWPGMFPDLQMAELKDSIALQLPDLEEGD